MKKMSVKLLSILLTLILILSSASVALAVQTVDLTFTNADSPIGGYSFNKLVGSVTVISEDTGTPLYINGFNNCENLTSVTIKGEGDVVIEEEAFWACPFETINFDLKGTVTIKTYAFGYSALSHIDFTGAEKVVLYGERCFQSSFLTEVNLTSNLSYDWDYEDWRNGDTEFFFAGCENLEKFTADCDSIPYAMFWCCPNIKSAYLTKKVSKIENDAFGINQDNSVMEDLTVYGYTASATEEYCNEYGIKFIPVDSAEFNTITSTQSADATVGVPSAVTLSVAGFPESLKLESPLCSEVIFTRADAEIVTSETGELWTVDLIPMSEADTYTVTADYGLADLCATDEITIFAEEDTTPPVISVETATPAVMGEYAKVNVTVKNSPEAIRFVDDNVTTIARENAVITENNDNTETWEVNLLVTGNEQQLTVFAKDETGWLTQGTDFTLKAKVIDYSTEISDFAFEESLDGVIYNGMNKITLTTANGISKVQFMKNGNTWTYTEDTAEVIEVDGKKHWTIKMNFWALGDQTYDIRVRTPKTTFEVTDTLNVTVYSR